MSEMSAEALVIQAEQRLAAAHLTLDLAVIADLLHDDYVIVQPGGRLETKSDVLASYASGERYWQSAEVEQLDVKLYGTAARVGGVWKAKGTNTGIPFDYQTRFISIWVQTGDAWKNISYASAEIAKD
ncbi:MAG: nuclear transport factor 2 family protein [Chloroflexota bacterium]